MSPPMSLVYVWWNCNISGPLSWLAMSLVIWQFYVPDIVISLVEHNLAVFLWGYNVHKSWGERGPLNEEMDH